MNGIELMSQEKSFMDRLGRLSGRMGATALSHILGCKVNLKVSEIFFYLICSKWRWMKIIWQVPRVCPVWVS